MGECEQWVGLYGQEFVARGGQMGTDNESSYGYNVQGKDSEDKESSLTVEDEVGSGRTSRYARLRHTDLPKPRNRE